jgi:hypothetical protein
MPCGGIHSCILKIYLNNYLVIAGNRTSLKNKHMFSTLI